MAETTRDVEGLLEQIESMVDGDYSEETEGDIDFTVCTACGGSPAQHYEDPPCPTGMLEEAAAEIRRLRSELERVYGVNRRNSKARQEAEAELERRDAALREYQERFGGVDNGKCKECGGYRDYDHGEPERCANDGCLSNLATGGDDEPPPAPPKPERWTEVA